MHSGYRNGNGVSGSTGRIAWAINGVRKNAPLALVDACVVVVAHAIALALRFGGRMDYLEDPILTVRLVALAASVQVLANIAFDIYWREWLVAALSDAGALVRASALTGAIVLIADLLSQQGRGLPISSIVLASLLGCGGMLAVRLRSRWRDFSRVAEGETPSGTQTVIVVGAGDLGQLLARELSGSRRYRIACFVDDDPQKLGRYIRGWKVLGDRAALPALVQRFRADIVAIAIGHPPGQLLREVTELCEELDVLITKVAGFADSLAGAARFQAIQLEDLLMRPPVPGDMARCRPVVEGRTIMVTGAAGSIGSEIVRQAVAMGAREVVLVDENESGLYDLSLEISYKVAVHTQLCDVRSSAAVERCFSKHRVDVVFHAAALKHAPMMEAHVLEAIATNVMGTLNCVRAASRSGVELFVFISTDKAVNPQGVMGATKRLGELIARAFANETATRFAVVRFGNVLGSRGSVVPTFLRQIDVGGPVTVTDPEVTRYFMTVPEAVGLVLQAASLAEHGDLFMLEMGTSVKIAELARRLIRLRGLRVGRDVEILFTGLRPGEKMHEELRFGHEQVVPTTFPRVYRLLDPISTPSVPDVLNYVAELQMLIESERETEARQRLFSLAAAVSAPAADEATAGG